MSRRPYAESNDSGVEWLGVVPSHWKVLPCRAIVHEKYQKNEGAACSDYLSLMANVGIIPYEEKGDIGNKKPEDLSKCKIVNKGDFVINSMNYGIGSYGVSGYDGVCSPVYIVLKPRLEVVEPRFAFRIFESRAFQTYAQSFGNGILAHRSAINWDILKKIGVGVPPMPEQRAILGYLDVEAAKIDALISEQYQILEYLNEKIVALASKALLGEAIEWVRLRYLCDEIIRPVIQESGEEYTPLGMYNRGRGLFHKDPRMMEDMGDSDFFWVEPDDLIFSGQFAWEGAVALAGAEEKGCVVSHRYPIIRGDGVNATTEYLYALFLTDYGNFLLNENSRGAAGRNRPLNLDSLLKEKVPVAPMLLQDEIKTAIVARKPLIQEAARCVALLQERRSALITAVVTGKVDVRGVVKETP
jgi:type I restriction enzyme S subunit